MLKVEKDTLEEPDATVHVKVTHPIYSIQVSLALLKELSPKKRS